MSHYRDTCIRTNLVVDTPIRERIDTQLPITLDQAKSWLKMDGIDDDDQNIQDLISEAVDWLEEYCGISAVPQIITSYLQVKNSLELPYGPVVEVISVDGSTDFSDSTFNMPSGYISAVKPGRYPVVYTAGYTELPAGLIGALKAYIAWAYEHRGDDLQERVEGISRVAIQKALPYVRNIGF